MNVVKVDSGTSVWNWVVGESADEKRSVFPQTIELGAVLQGDERMLMGSTLLFNFFLTCICGFMS